MTSPTDPVSYADLSPAAQRRKALEKLDQVLAGLGALTTTVIKQGAETVSDLTDLTAAVTEISGQTDSVVTLVNGLAAKIEANANDPAALAALAQQIRDDSSRLAEAVASAPADTGSPAASGEPTTGVTPDPNAPADQPPA